MAAAAYFPVHALGETYHLTQSATRIQETNSPGVIFHLNVTGATAALNYQFTWSVRDPSGATKNLNTQVASAPSSFVATVNYPADFGISLTLVGNYSLTVTQTSPPPSTSPAGTAVFTVGLIDAQAYQRTNPVSIVAQGYQVPENVSISISSSSGLAPGFPTIRPTSTGGVLAFTWTSIPYNIALGNYTVTLTGSKTTKSVLDTQAFTINPAKMTIQQLTITQSSVQRTQLETFRFSALYPNSLQARTGSANIRVTEADGTTVHNITATYKTTLSLFEGGYRIPLNSTTGAWVASIDIGGFDDGYGNRGPAAGVVRGFAVSPAILTVVVSTGQGNYTLGNVLAIYASVVTPGGANFTSGTVLATTEFSNRPIGSSIQLSYDQTRGKWVGGYTINATNPSGVWLVDVNATDQYNNFGAGSTSILVTVPPQQPMQQPLQQTSTFAYLELLVIVLVAALTILGSWVVYRRGRISRRVLKVDLQAIHDEAQKVENQEFFKKVKEQLKEQKSEDPNSQTGK